MLAGAMSLISAPALANGRYPNADMLIVDPGDPNHLVLRATFGTLVSDDQGQRWSWICEDAVGYAGLRDPAITVLADGRLLHAFLGNIVLSAAQGCSFAPVPFNTEGRFAVDITLDPADPSHAWVLASGLLGRRQASMLEVADSASPPRLVAEDFVPYTIEVARSRPQRIYVVGFNGRFEATLLASDDRGESWQAHPIALYPALPMYLSAVAPADPDTLYVRVDDGTSDHLIVSRDGGQSFVEVLTIPTEMLGFALSPDGSRLAAGGPDVPLQVASTTDFAFAPAADIKSLRCLTWAEAGLFACAQESLDNWTLARSSDGGQSFTPLWHVQDLVPLECDASTSTGSVCPRAWLDVSAQIGAELVPSDDPQPMQPVRGAERDGGCAFDSGASRRSLGLAALAALLGTSGAAAWRRRSRRRGACRARAPAADGSAPAGAAPGSLLHRRG
jgi:hypothetical protein